MNACGGWEIALVINSCGRVLSVASTVVKEKRLNSHISQVLIESMKILQKISASTYNILKLVASGAVFNCVSVMFQ